MGGGGGERGMGGMVGQMLTSQLMGKNSDHGGGYGQGVSITCYVGQSID